MSRSGAGRVLYIFLFMAPVWSQLVSTAENKQVLPQCTVRDAATTCVCESLEAKGGQAQSVNAATLSESANTLQVQCTESSTFVPSDLDSVCTGATGEASITTCEKSKNPITKVKISTLLSKEADPGTKWTKKEQNSHSLTILSTDFPLVDRHFFIGCGEKQTEGNSCVVNVTLNARTSALAGNVLTCAYGETSNLSIPKVALDSTNDSLTVVCGGEGAMPESNGAPTIFLCKDPETDVCTKVADVPEVFPGFSKAWWTKQDGQENAAKLTIPKDGFPVEPKTIMLGCSLQGKSPTQKETAEEDGSSAALLPTCKVKVTVAAGASSFSTMSLSAGVLLLSIMSLAHAYRMLFISVPHFSIL
ncbi:SAG-related sequence [Besnoitia besnoiti]|uniref:SAG-related sequence n=1 Tax=Besnoitia besnoiti TaxID=94643 RepID=A0A2A9MBL2_BESBE|nr:SAG-related sequence [Besnoitia besnoiti]PFH35269.1 SAG-related sequence [Besnoitia besnoiti]